MAKDIVRGLPLNLVHCETFDYWLVLIIPSGGSTSAFGQARFEKCSDMVLLDSFVQCTHSPPAWPQVIINLEPCRGVVYLFAGSSGHLNLKTASRVLAAGAHYSERHKDVKSSPSRNCFDLSRSLFA